jgi:hypothetical protein
VFLYCLDEAVRGVMDLTLADPNGDYSVVLEEIFAADSVQVW